MSNCKIELISIKELTHRSKNPRTHSKKQIQQIADSIKQFGFTNPVLIDKHNMIIAGHGRVEAVKLRGIDKIETICLENLTEDEIRAYVIADNRLAENAGWDRELLAIELQGLTEIGLDFEVTVTGFEMAEIDVLIGEFESGTKEIDSADEVIEVDDGSPVTRLGDIWSLGNHRLICGDATDAGTYARLLENAKAEMIFTDPPYNVPIDGHVSGLGQVKHREFVMASGEMSEAEFIDFLATAFGNLAQFSVNGSMHFICMDWRHMGEVITAGQVTYTELKNLCVWAKTNGGMGSLYRSQHELVFVFKAGQERHINNIELGKYGRNRTNLWSYAGISSFGKERDAELALHPTVKPTKLIADAILDCSNRGGIILDAFAGSGTTLIAAEKTGRCGYGIELDPRYCDVIIKRMTNAFNTDAVHTATGKSFSQIEHERAAGQCEKILA